MKKGYFITLEGGEGSGKTTVAKEISLYLKNKSLEVVMVREPGSTDIGDQIRTILLDNLENTGMNTRAELLLFEASRAQLVSEIMLPSLRDGKIVLCDRYGDSTMAYQTVNPDGSWAYEVHNNNMFATQNLVPNTTLWFDVSPKVGLGRRRKGTAFSGEDWNRLDDMELAYHQRVRQNYSIMHDHDEENRWVRIDANNDLETVVKDTICKIESRLMMAGILEGQKSNPERRG